jgi:hypothetical protein
MFPDFGVIELFATQSADRFAVFAQVAPIALVSFFMKTP